MKVIFMDSLLFRVSVILGGWGAALYYRVVPSAASLFIAKVHAAVAVTGAVLFPIGIASVVLGGRERFEPVVATGAIVVIIGMVLFGFVVFRTSGAKLSASVRERSIPVAETLR
jgi:hypothetical protein